MFRCVWLARKINFVLLLTQKIHQTLTEDDVFMHNVPLDQGKKKKKKLSLPLQGPLFQNSAK